MLADVLKRSDCVWNVPFATDEFENTILPDIIKTTGKGLGLTGMQTELTRRTFLVLLCLMCLSGRCAHAAPPNSVQQQENRSEAKRLTSQALSASGKIGDPSLLANVRSQIAQVLARAGDLQGAKVIADTLDDDLKAEVLIAIAAAKSSAGDLAGAQKALTDVADGLKRVKAACKLAAERFQAGDNKGYLLAVNTGLDTAGKIKDNLEQISALFDIAGVQAHSGKTTLAAELESVFKGNPLFENRAAMIVAIGKAYGRDVAGAQRKLAAFTLNDYKVPVLEAIADVLLRSGDKSGANAAILKLQSFEQFPLFRPIAMARIVQILAKHGDAAGAKQTLKLMLKLAQTDGDEMEIEQVAESQAEAGDTGGATQTLALIAKASNQFEPRRKIARAKAKAGDAPGALAMAPHDPDPYGKILEA